MEIIMFVIEIAGSEDNDYFIPLEMNDGKEILSGPESLMSLKGILKPLGIEFVIHKLDELDLSSMGYSRSFVNGKLLDPGVDHD